MKQKLCLITILLLTALIGSAAAPQDPDVKKLPDDPRVKTGKLANGLTYYVIRNDAVKGHADFAVAQKVGTSLEEGNQKGMCKMLELLSTRGTRNFTDSTIVKYLNSIGVGSKNIIFETGADEIVYTIGNVPVGSQNTMDSTLLILYNWMASINIDEEDVAQTMPMLRNSLIDQFDAQERIDDALRKELYPKSPYARTITAGQINSLDTYSSKELRNFYYQWFRPDLQAVFVVGDIDIAKVETQIKSIFATIPKPLKAGKRTYYTPKAVNGTQVVIGKDPEYDKTSVSIDFQSMPLTDKYKLTSVPYIEGYFNHAISTLLSARIQEGIVAQNLPISNVRINRGKFMDMANMETFCITFETLPESVYSAISFMSGEINRMAKSGFNPQEFSNSREIYFRELDNIYSNRFNQSNAVFMKRAMENWFYGFSLASIEMHFEIMKEILYTLKTSQLNSYAEALLGKKEGVVISCRMPDVEGIDELSPDRIRNSFVNSLSKSSYTAQKEELVNWPKFISGDRQVSIVGETQDPLSGAYMFALSNGIRVFFKKTEGSLDTVSFRAVSKGGLSVVRENLGRDIELYISDIANLSAVGGLSSQRWDKLSSYNNLSLKVKINDHMEELCGYSGKESLEKLFHLINLNFTQRQDDYGSFDIYRRGKSYEAIYRKLSPKKVFEDSVEFYNFSNKRFIPTHSKEFVDNMDYYRIQKAIAGRLANPADFVFAFAGNVEIEELKGYVVKYLGSLHTSHETEEWFVTPDYHTKGKVSRSFLHRMVIPRTYVDATVSCGMQNTQENVVLSGLLQEYLHGICSGGKVKELSPRSTVSAGIEYYPEEIMICRSRFETDSAGAAEILNILDSRLRQVAYNGLPESGFAALKESFMKKVTAAMATNAYWVDAFVDSYLFGKDFHAGYLAAISGMTQAKFKDFVDMVYRRGNMVTVVMEGTTQDVNTQNLFRENQFIRDFFDL
ncbi:MAG: insulinase family protein [Bacteroidales bacterium]|nr:insulinase family protein [Bacteroidales bacterium]